MGVSPDDSNSDSDSDSDGSSDGSDGYSSESEADTRDNDTMSSSWDLSARFPNIPLLEDAPGLARAV